ncbi:unnamed protein product [Rotaria socialis]|uniref:Bromo domain-containing protein n=1 Tax=Rotaria socialis TaxID=392032 RepID=A0A818W2A9_9BILA|nr:unnamed protein product [Rotaria socialis]CAF3719491.1 unnamed protein product [Rotaria socialis]
MTTENQHMDKSKLSSTNVDSPGQMRGWFKLMETIRKTESPPTSSNDLNKSSMNSSITTPTNTNGHLSESPGTIYLDHLASKSPNLTSPPSIISLTSTPLHSSEDIPVVHIPPITKAKEPRRSSIRRKKITIRKSARSKEFSGNNTTSNDDNIKIDTHQRKRQSNDLILPLATDLESLPGHNHDESRDRRFVNYTDMNTLSVHFNACLSIDKKSFSSSFLTRQHIFKTRHNVLNKIFKLYYLKTYENYFKHEPKIFGKNKDTKSDSLLSTSASFKTDWSVYRRNSSSYKRDPKNFFHILQLNPKKDLLLSTDNQSATNLTIEEQQKMHYEQVKDILVRTYYPHLHTTVQNGYYFGSKSKLLVQNQDLPIFIKSESPISTDETTTTTTITLKSPISTGKQEFRTRGRRPKHRKLKDKSAPIISMERRVSEEIPPVVINEPTPVLKSTEVPSSASSSSIEYETTNYRKRKISLTINTNIDERKKKKILPPPPSPEFINEYEETVVSDNSDEDLLPEELPKQNFIKNGLRSNYYKTTTDINVKSMSNKNRAVRRRQQLSGALPPFYKGIFESDDDKLGYIDYQLPFDIYWFSQQLQPKTIDIPLKPMKQSKKKKLNPPKQKLPQPSPSKKVISKLSTDSPVESKPLPSNNTDQKQQKIIRINKDLIKIEALTEDEKQIISKSRIFLKRNIRRLKEKQELKDKNNSQHRQHIEEQPLPIFFAQNYHHPNLIKETNSSTKNSSLSHKDLLNLFYNHIRRSHSYKSGQCSIELVDETCYYAQLAQLNLILNEIFDLLLNYKCLYTDIYPSNALKKCPLKRSYPMYYEIILKPMDLTMIRNKLDNGEYFSYDFFEQDLLLLFKNAITYCGADSDVGRAVKELETYLMDILKPIYQSTIDLFNNMTDTDKNERNSASLQYFIERLHEKETMNGQIREILYDIIYNVGPSTPVVYKTVQANTTNTNRTTKTILTNDSIVHCRCGSVYDEVSLVQCYACQLWQHVSCVVITDTSQPYYCFECHPMCEQNPSFCLKTNVRIPLRQPFIQISHDNYPSYSTITRSDGFIIRINECYFIEKQEESSSLSQYNIFFIERLWIDDNNIELASGFYYLRSYETFHEANRKFFCNELFRFPSVNDSIEINSIIRPCYVLDAGTYCKGKPMCEYSSRILATDLFICEYRVDKLARIFTRLPKPKHAPCNMKSYCFDNYIEKLSIKRDYQPHQKESHNHHQPTPHRRSTTHSVKLTTKQFEEKSSRIDGIIEKIYCRFHHPNLIPNEAKFSPNQFLQQPIIDPNSNRISKRLRNKHPSSSSRIINKKRRTRSISSNEYLPECTLDNTQWIISSLIDELIESIVI